MRSFYLFLRIGYWYFFFEKKTVIIFSFVCSAKDTRDTRDNGCAEDTLLLKRKIKGYKKHTALFVSLKKTKKICFEKIRVVIFFFVCEAFSVPSFTWHRISLAGFCMLFVSYAQPLSLAAHTASAALSNILTTFYLFH